MKRRVPRLATDEEAEAFLESDLTDLDFSQFKSGRLRFENAANVHNSAPSETYRLFEQAMIEERQIICMYGGRRREVCPVILGHRQGEERALTYQFDGETNTSLPAGGEWRCLDLSKVSRVELRDGPWISGASHTQPSRCVDEVDLDVNPRSPYKPKRSLEQLRASARVGPRPAQASRQTKSKMASGSK